MTTPVLQAQGAINAVTTGNLSVTLPTYAANDIVIIQTVFFTTVPTGTTFPATPSGWSAIFSTPDYGYPILGAGNLISSGTSIWWARATSGSSLGTSVTITRPADWATGNSTCWAVRSYVIRGCITTGTPYENYVEFSLNQTVSLQTSTAANGLIAGARVNGGDRLVIAFLASADNQNVGAAPTGWVAGTAVSTTTGTDAGFQVFTISGVNTTVNDVLSNTSAPVQGSYSYFTLPFRPPNPRYTLVI